MKTEPRRFRTKVLQSTCWTLITAAAFFPISARPDGCFVVPKFVWDKHKDINEPTQKAIIAYDAGREDLILQVKYDGPVEEFGWLIPVPGLPTVKEGSMECFYELSKYTQKKFEYGQENLSMSLRASGASEEPEPPVKVIEIKTVGAYEVAVLSTRDANALENWLAANQFAFPQDKVGVIDSYVKKGWYFVAAKINLGRTTGFEVISGAPKTGVSVKTRLEEKLSSGELHPLHLSFASEMCVFPLKISSVNGKPSEVQVYVLSVEPLVEKGIFEQKLSENYDWRANMLARLKETTDHRQALRASFGWSTGRQPEMPAPDDRLSSRSMVNDEELFPYAQVSRKDLPVCSKEISLPNGQQRWLTKLTYTFKPEEMRDLEFVPAIPEFTAHLQDGEGAFAAANLARLGGNGASALLTAMESPNPAVRAHATSVTEEMHASSRSQMNGELVKRLPALLKDTEPEVRLHAIEAAVDSGDAKFFGTALELLRDDYPEISGAAVNYLARQREEASKHVPLFRQMLKDTNSTVQMAGLRLLFNMGIKIPREELLPLFSVPRMEVAGLTFQILQKDGISCEDAKPLLQNPGWMVRLLGLRVLAENTNKDSVEFAIPLLRDSEEGVRMRAHDLLTDLTGQKIPADQPDQWEKWWSESKATFVLDPDQMAQRRMERMRQRRDAIRRQNLPDGP